MNAVSHVASGFNRSSAALDVVHGGYVHSRRVRVLADCLAPLIPRRASVIDIGAGDGRLASAILDRRPDVQIRGIDVLVRPDAVIAVDEYDGARIPFGDGRFDVAMCVDALHHAPDPRALLAEAARVANRVLLKDHLCDGWLAGPTLRLMDVVGNRRHGVALPFTYLSRREWNEAFAEDRLEIETWRTRIPLYPWPASVLFGRGLHFIALLSIPMRARVEVAPGGDRRHECNA